MKLLVKEIVYFIDGTGEIEEGGDTKFITEDERYSKLDSDKYYISSCFLSNDIKDIDLVDINEYYSTYSRYNVKTIIEEQAIEIQEILDKYNKI